MGQNSQLLFIIGMVAVFYLLVLRPQQKRAKQQRQMLDALSVGDEIVTIGGIYAIVVETGERLRVRVVDGTELEIARQAVGRVLSEDETGSSTGDDATTGEHDADEAPAQLAEEAPSDTSADAPAADH
ncbi:MAG: preprotein translocase subunit YajC [Coriobacteriia bacterium]|nr:preprotein translocase subunit YajC [Coriobacteriia bacterium]